MADTVRCPPVCVVALFFLVHSVSFGHHHLNCRAVVDCFIYPVVPTRILAIRFSSYERHPLADLNIRSSLASVAKGRPRSFRSTFFLIMHRAWFHTMSCTNSGNNNLATFHIIRLAKPLPFL